MEVDADVDVGTGVLVGSAVAEDASEGIDVGVETLLDMGIRPRPRPRPKP